MKNEKKTSLFFVVFGALLLLLMVSALFLRKWIELPSGYTGPANDSFTVAEQEVSHPLGTPSFTVTVYNNGYNGIDSLDYHLEELRGGKWYRLKLSPLPEERVLETGGPELTIDLSRVEKELEPGSYRAVFPLPKDKDDYFAVYFELTAL